MRVIFITAHPYLPQMYGGLQTSTDELCAQLSARGHFPEVLCALMPGGTFGLVSRLRLKFKNIFSRCVAVSDLGCGYRIWRAWHPWQAVAEVIRHSKPDVIVVLAVQPVKMALAALPLGIPILMKLQDVEFSQHGGDFSLLGNIPAVANSHFTADTYRKAFGINPKVIYPFIDLKKYETCSSGENVTFINPHKFKGLSLALAVARLCPEIPFTFVESWPLKISEQQELAKKLQDLRNVTLLKPRRDMREVYKKCRILLVPSLWAEGYGRVATEAQVSGIPVIASTRGGLPEAVGGGGILLDAEADPALWAGELKRLWNDQAYYAELSLAARQQSQREEMSLDFHVQAWENLLNETKDAHTRAL